MGGVAPVSRAAWDGKGREGKGNQGKFSCVRASERVELLHALDRNSNPSMYCSRDSRRINVYGKLVRAPGVAGDKTLIHVNRHRESSCSARTLLSRHDYDVNTYHVLEPRHVI
ncbi:hypothetical protein ACLOJK_040163 [Asimina triloba]